MIKRLLGLGSLWGVFIVKMFTTQTIFFLWVMCWKLQQAYRWYKCLFLYPNCKPGKHCLELLLLWNNIDILKILELERFLQITYQSLCFTGEAMKSTYRFACYTLRWWNPRKWAECQCNLYLLVYLEPSLESSLF